MNEKLGWGSVLCQENMLQAHLERKLVKATFDKDKPFFSPEMTANRRWVGVPVPRGVS